MSSLINSMYGWRGLVVQFLLILLYGAVLFLFPEIFPSGRGFQFLLWGF